MQNLSSANAITMTPRRGLVRRFSCLAFACAVLAAPLNINTKAHAEEAKMPSTITITGQGSLSVAPDMATITTQVLTQAKTASQALNENTQTLTSVINQIKEAGVEAKDIQTSGFSISPSYRPQKNYSETLNEIAGYQVYNGVSVTVRDLKKLGKLIETVVNSGVNQINNISFRVSDAEEKLDEARKNAVANAKKRAELYAQAAGVSLGRILSISETGHSAPQPMLMAARSMAVADESMPVPVEAGQETLSSSVTITWELQN